MSATKYHVRNDGKTQPLCGKHSGRTCTSYANSAVEYDSASYACKHCLTVAKKIADAIETFARAAA